jgi:HEAT repeat protein
MEKNEENLEASLKKLRSGGASVEDVRSIALELGGYKYTPGIPALVELLDHRDDMVRYNAAGSLATDFKYVPATGKLLTMLASDPDEDCRSIAASSLGTLYNHTRNHLVIDALGKASLEDSDVYVRDSAYRALLIVNGISKEQHLNFFRNPPHVDPDRVRSILAEVSDGH